MPTSANAPGEHRSYSQLSAYERCPYGYYLTRLRDDIEERPDAWRPHGTALHAAAEFWERSGRTASRADVEERFTEVYKAEINAELERVPNLNYWAWSGEVNGEDDIPRRLALGLAQVGAYIDYYRVNPDQKPWATPEGEPAIEHRLEVDLGGVRVVAVIDMILSHPKYGVIVRDNKISAPPAGSHQLCVYAVVANEVYGTAIDLGDYWIGKRGKPGRIRHLAGRGGEQCTSDYLGGQFAKLDENIKAGNFPPNPSRSTCRSCSVNAHCSFRAI
jgi:putative RecB family exonuclease